MVKEDWLQHAIIYMKKQLANDSSGHDAAHSLRVYHNAQAIAQTLPAADQTVVALSAILHDTVDAKLFNESQAYAQLADFLKSLVVPTSTREAIFHVVRTISFSKDVPPEQLSLEAQIVQDADRLDALGAIGIARTFAFGATRHDPMYAADSFPVAVARKRAQTGKLSPSTINHFYEKLLTLKDSMNTAYGLELAEQRHEFMMKFLEQFAQEI